MIVLKIHEEASVRVEEEEEADLIIIDDFSKSFCAIFLLSLLIRVAQHGSNFTL